RSENRNRRLHDPSISRGSVLHPFSIYRFVSCSKIHRKKGHKLYRAARGMAFAGSVYKGLARKRRSTSACAADLRREDAAWTHPDLQMEHQRTQRGPRFI